MKKLISLSLTATLAASVVGMTAIADDNITVLVNNEKVIFEDQEPFIENDRTLVPMRAIFEALGATVEWDGETQTVISYDPISEVSVVLQIGSNKMFINDRSIELDVPAKIENDRTVVPVRAIAEGMNSKVDWDQENLTVLITKDIGGTNAQIANPWQEYATLDALNAAIESNSDADIKYAVADPSMPAEVSENGYRYLASENMVEIQGRWEVGAGADMVIRTKPGDADISGIYGGEKLEEYTLNDSLVEVYRYAENTVYAVWSCEDAGTVYSHSVAVTSADFDTTEVVKTLAEDVETHHPRG